MEPPRSGGGLNCDFATGRVMIVATFDDPATALTTLSGALRSLERFGRAYADGVRSEGSYRLWAAAEKAPPKLPSL